MTPRRVMVIGLDCVPPRFAFDLYEDAMPRLSQLRAGGTWGPLQSCVPPITVPAWATMFSGRDPGELGVYGFQRRERGSYAPRLVQPDDLQARRVWHMLADAGKRVAALFVPPSYPPEAHCGIQIGCFLTPDAAAPHTEPQPLQAELAARFGPYRMDVDDVRSEDPGPLLSELCAMSSQHFDTARHIWRSERPDFMAMVDIGPDRFHHAFYQHVEPAHPRHVPGNPFADAAHRYYGLLDRKLGELIDEAGPNTTVLVVSDHGARPLLGGVCLNEWLIERGYLVLESYPDAVQPFGALRVDWRHTRAFGEGGYCGRVQLNLAGREPEGIVTPSDAPRLLDEIEAGLGTIGDPDGRPLHNRCVRAHSYRAQRGRPPDLQVFFGDLSYRAIASVGHRAMHLPGNDRGPDGCNHDWQGIFVMAGGGAPARGAVSGYAIYDVAKTVLGLLHVQPDNGLLGHDRSV